MIIEVDEYKKKIPGYDPKNSELFHRESAKLADKDFLKEIKSGKYKKIIFMAGGTASGKTEFALSYITGEDELVYDGTMKNIEGFKIKLRNIQKYSKNESRVKVILIIPENTKNSFAAFLQRDRKMENRTFFDTHIRSKLSVAKILLETDTKVEIYTSRIGIDSSKLEFIVLEIEDRSVTAKDLILAARNLYQTAKNLEVAIDIDFDIV